MNKKYIFRSKTSSEHYTAQAYVLRCFDDRFWKAFKNFLKQAGYVHIDPASVAGGAKTLSSPEKESDRDFILWEIEKSIRLHHTAKVLLFTHHDCGAYGGFERFNRDPEAELAFHREELARAKAAVLSRFPGIKVRTYFIDEEGVIETSNAEH